MSEKIKDTIAKLLAKAERTDNEHERNAFQEKVAQLMRDYAIEQAEIDERRKLHGHAGEKMVERRFEVTGSYARFLIQMYFSIPRALKAPVETYRIGNGKSNRQGWFCVVGYESDADQMVTLLQSLGTQALLSMKSFAAHHPNRGWLSPRDAQLERNAFLQSYSNGVYTRLVRIRTARDAEQENTTGTELVLARDARVKEWLAEQHPEMRQERGPQQAAGSSFSRARGFEAGLKAHTGESQLNQTKGISA